MISLILRSLALICVLALAASAQAHQIKSAFTKILFNPRTQNLEIMHRFYIHDAEHAMQLIFGERPDLLTDNQDQAKFADYVSQRFFISSVQQDLPLKLVGVETEGKFLWVYQETQPPAGMQALTIRHNALREIWPTQVNTLNIEGQGELKTLTFDGNIELLEVNFSQH